jgi:hypothetical protein
MERVFYKVVTPDPFSNFNCNSLEEAKAKLSEFKSLPENDHHEYWERVRKGCKIVKVTEITEDVNLKESL